MVRPLILRFLATFVLTLTVASADLVTASPLTQPGQLQRQDIGDDDGDGIPNYADPYDNRLEDQEEETPADPPVTDPEPEDTVEETPAEPEIPVDEIPAEPEAPAEETPAETTVPNLQPSAPQVAALPNTGVGNVANSLPAAALALIGLALASSFALGLTFRIREP